MQRIVENLYLKFNTLVSRELVGDVLFAVREIICPNLIIHVTDGQMILTLMVGDLHYQHQCFITHLSQEIQEET